MSLFFLFRKNQVLIDGSFELGDIPAGFHPQKITKLLFGFGFKFSIKQNINFLNFSFEAGKIKPIKIQ